MGVDWWGVSCWVRRFTTANTPHHQYFLVKRCASANKPWMAGGCVHFGGCRLVSEWVAGCVGWCVNWLVPTLTTPLTTISLLCQRDAYNNISTSNSSNTQIMSKHHASSNRTNATTAKERLMRMKLQRSTAAAAVAVAASLPCTTGIIMI